MINISSIQNPLGGLLRLCLRAVPSGTILPILQGKLRGKLWVKGSGVNGYWLGTYELKKQELFAKIVKSNDIVYDVGANVGFYTLLASILAKKVYAFEPAQRNIVYLEKHIALNHRKNIEILPFAVSDFSGTTSFIEGIKGSSLGGRIGDGGISVSCTTLDALSIEPPTVMKIDVEGEEVKVLEGGMNLLTRHKPSLLLATHNEELESDCIKILKKIGYEIEKYEENELYAHG